MEAELAAGSCCVNLLCETDKIDPLLSLLIKSVKADRIGTSEVKDFRLPTVLARTGRKSRLWTWSKITQATWLENSWK